MYSILVVWLRPFRHYADRFEEDGLDGLLNERVCRVSAHRAPTDDFLRAEVRVRERYDGWTVKHVNTRRSPHFAPWSTLRDPQSGHSTPLGQRVLMKYGSASASLESGERVARE